MSITKETDLVLPSLIVISQTEDLISTKTLKKYLKTIVELTDADKETLPNRKTTKFDNKVENLVSHKKLADYVDYHKIGSKTYMKINKNGSEYVKRHFANLEVA